MIMVMTPMIMKVSRDLEDNHLCFSKVDRVSFSSKAENRLRVETSNFISMGFRLGYLGILYYCLKNVFVDLHGNSLTARLHGREYK